MQNWLYDALSLAVLLGFMSALIGAFIVITG